MKLSVIIPCYNEVGTLAKLVQRVTEASYSPKEIIVVDDGSTDGTQDLLRSGSISGVDRVILKGLNQGKGAALRAGIRAATGEVVVFQHADLEYDPSDYEKLIRPILEDRADVVFGSRFLGSGAYTTPLLRSPVWQWRAHLRLKHVHQSQPHRHGNLLQNVSP